MSLSEQSLAPAFARAAALIDQAEAVLITAGAGMGIDSGLPDFRGNEGFWQVYPALGRAGMNFQSIACPEAFRAHPRLAWGFYGHRLNLYRHAEPHAGFRLLLELVESMPDGGFVFTSNVDGQFQKAGFGDGQLCEVHGSIHHLQCLDGCGADIWPAQDFEPLIDDAECRLTSPLPTCPGCGGLARPNILMFGDWGWRESRSAAQEAAMRQWYRRTGRCVVIELGAGTAIPTVRMVGQQTEAPLIRINPREGQVPRATDVSLPCGALVGVQGIVQALKAAGSGV